MNIYAPNRDDPNFFKQLKQHILEAGNTNILIVGDWNLLLEPDVDGTNYKNINNQNARVEVCNMIAKLNLYDIWREEHPEERKFTWKRKLKNNTLQMGRLDFILVSDEILRYCHKESILPGYRSDHSMVSVNLQMFKHTTKPKLFWKFNSQLLKDENFTKKVKEQIVEVKREYEEPRPNAANDLDIENNEYKSYLGPQLFLEILLLKTRELAIKHSSAKKKEAKNETETLEKEIRNLEKNITINKVEELREKKRAIGDYSTEAYGRSYDQIPCKMDWAWGKGKQLLLPLGKEKLSVKADDVSCERRPNRDHGCNNDHRGNKDILHQPVQIERKYKLRWWIQHSFEGLAQTNRRRSRDAKWRFNFTRSLNSAEEHEEQQKPRDRWI